MTIFLVVSYFFICRYQEFRLEEHFTRTDPMILEIHAILTAIDPEAAGRITMQKNTSSYTINKKHMHLCVHDGDEYFSKNMLLYVALHELAHVICDEIGHTDKFHRIFDDILDRAVKLGLYNPKIPPNGNYIDVCGGEDHN